MANSGIGFFDRRGEYFRTPEEATISDLSSILGRIGEGDSIAPGIAVMLLDRRSEIEQIFAEHDRMCESKKSSEGDREVVVLKRG
jgi:hypothetical protein